MDMIPLKPERKAQLEEYAQRRGQDPAAALDDALAAYLEWEHQDFMEAVEGIRQGYEEVKTGRTRPVAELLADLRQKHGIPVLRQRHRPMRTCGVNSGVARISARVGIPAPAGFGGFMKTQ